MEVPGRGFLEVLKQSSIEREKVQKCLLEMRSIISQYEKTRMCIVGLLIVTSNCKWIICKTCKIILQKSLQYILVALQGPSVAVRTSLGF